MKSEFHLRDQLPHLFAIVSDTRHPSHAKVDVLEVPIAQHSEGDQSEYQVADE